MVEIADLDKDGEWHCRFREHPRGYFVYDLTGQVHIQIVKVPALPPFPEAKLTESKPPLPAHAPAAYTAYVAYFGTYTVDPGRPMVTHHVEGSLAPDFTDTHQPRPFKLEGDRLEIGMARLGGAMVAETVRRERHWTSAGANPARPPGALRWADEN